MTQINPLVAIGLAAFTAFLTLLGGAFLARWKASADEVRGHCDDVIEAVADAADLASEYWLTAPDLETALVEARLLGFQWKVNLMVQSVRWRFSALHQSGVDLDLQDFQAASTGGGFQVKGRAIDTSRALESQMSAAQLIV